MSCLQPTKGTYPFIRFQQCAYNIIYQGVNILTLSRIFHKESYCCLICKKKPIQSCFVMQNDSMIIMIINDKNTHCSVFQPVGSIWDQSYIRCFIKHLANHFFHFAVELLQSFIGNLIHLIRKSGHHYKGRLKRMV